VAPRPGLSARLSYLVTDADTASALGSGDVPVLATPRLLAWLEAATVAALSPAVDAGTTTVGTHVCVDHLLATPVGGRLEVSADVLAVDGRTVELAVSARDGPGRTVATGVVRRAVVDRDRFLAGLPVPGQTSSR